MNNANEKATGNHSEACAARPYAPCFCDPVHIECMNNATQTTGAFEMQVFRYSRKWVAVERFATKEAAEKRVKIQKRDDWDNGLGALSYRVVPVTG